MPQGPGVVHGDLTVLGQIKEGTAPVLGDVGQIMGVVVHGSTAGTARPAVIGPVMWIGTVAPTNKLANDPWLNPSGGGASFVSSVTDTTSIDLTVASGALTADVKFDAVAPVALTPDIAAAVGTAGVPARRDHVHNVPAAAPTTNLTPSTTNAEGSGSSFARNDHTHAVTGFLPLAGGAMTGLLDLMQVSTDQALDASSALGDKIALWATTQLGYRFAIGVQSSALVAAVPTGSFLQVRTTPASGAATSGAPGVTISPNGWVRALDTGGTATTPNHSFITDTNTGMYNAGADNLGFTVGGTHRLGITTTAITSVLPVLLPNGTVGAPALAPSGDPDTGLYSVSANRLGITAQGVQVMSLGHDAVGYGVRVNAPAADQVPLRIQAAGSQTARLLEYYGGFGTLVSGVASGGAYEAPDGIATAPGFRFLNDPNTGLYSVAADELGITAGGTLRLTVKAGGVVSTVPIHAPYGTMAAPSIAAASDPDTGLRWDAANPNGLFITAGGTDVFYISDTSASFGATPVTVGTPTSASHAATKSYVDDWMDISTSFPAASFGKLHYNPNTNSLFVSDAGDNWVCMESMTSTDEAPTTNSVTIAAASTDYVWGTSITWTPTYTGKVDLHVFAMLDIDASGRAGNIEIQKEEAGNGSWLSVISYRYHDAGEGQNLQMSIDYTDVFTADVAVRYRVVIRSDQASSVILRGESIFALTWWGRA